MDLKILIALVLACLLVQDGTADKIKGMGWGTGHDLWGIRQYAANESLKIMTKAGVNYAHISAYVKMKNERAWTYRRETDDDSIRYQIRMMKENGLKVFFKPVIEIDGETWRGFIPGRPKWLYTVYVPFIVSMAKIANEEDVDLFAVGSEYRDTMIGKENEAAWRYIIKRVRRVYWNDLTYVANSYEKCKFWDALDIISISGYWVLLDGNIGTTYGHSPNMKTTKELWEQKAAKVNKWRVRRGYWNKEILIAEVGFQSKGRGVVYRKPYDWKVQAPVNYYEQTKMYEALLSAFFTKPWCIGIVFWNWELHPYANRWEPYKSGYTPQNKPAMKVMQKYFLWKKES